MKDTFDVILNFISTNPGYDIMLSEDPKSNAVRISVSKGRARYTQIVTPYEMELSAPNRSEFVESILEDLKDRIEKLPQQSI